MTIKTVISNTLRKSARNIWFDSLAQAVMIIPPDDDCRFVMAWSALGRGPEYRDVIRPPQAQTKRLTKEEERAQILALVEKAWEENEQRTDEEEDEFEYVDLIGPQPAPPLQDVVVLKYIYTDYVRILIEDIWAQSAHEIVEVRSEIGDRRAIMSLPLFIETAWYKDRRKAILGGFPWHIYDTYEHAFGEVTSEEWRNV